MNPPLLHALLPILIGTGATLTLDLWALLLKHAFKIAPSNFCLVGRWLGYMPEGRFTHPDIASASPKKAECGVGWIAHYATGVLFAAVFVRLTGEGWLRQPTPLPALLFGIATVAAPFFIMQPAFGSGWAASRARHPAQARLRSLVNHAVFGTGLYLFGALAGWLYGFW